MDMIHTDMFILSVNDMFVAISLISAVYSKRVEQLSVCDSMWSSDETKDFAFALMEAGYNSLCVVRKSRT